MNASSSTFSLNELTSAAVASFSAERAEPSWLLDIRKTAFANFSALPWPDAKDPRWKRANPGAFDWTKISLGATLTPGREVDALEGPLRTMAAVAPANGSAPARRFIDLGRAQATDAPASFRERNVEWLSLEDAVRLHPERIRDAWTSAVERAKADKFRSLTLAFANVGSCLIVPRGQAIKAPIQATIGGGERGTAYFPLNFLFLDEASEAQVWEELVGSGDDAGGGFVSSCSVIELKENAKGAFYFLQRWDAGTTHFQFQDVAQGSFSRFNAVAVSIGGKLFRNETVVRLQGQGAENKVLGVLFGDGHQEFENWISQYHEAPKTTSDIQYRGALKGSARSFFSGLVDIQKHAQQSDAFQAAKTLLLSREAKADAIPNLEILADDVKCSHGAAVGPVDEDQKYYLQTRGVPPVEAENIIVQGFFEPVIAEVPSEPVQERLRSFVQEKLAR